jgi:hypothetical protein
MRRSVSNGGLWTTRTRALSRAATHTASSLTGRRLVNIHQRERDNSHRTRCFSSTRCSSNRPAMRGRATVRVFQRPLPDAVSTVMTIGTQKWSKSGGKCFTAHIFPARRGEMADQELSQLHALCERQAASGRKDVRRCHNARKRFRMHPHKRPYRGERQSR